MSKIIADKRIAWPDFCKGVAIILVVIGHAIGYVSSNGGVMEAKK